MKTIGIDIGSITTKIALMENNKLVKTNIISSGYDTESAGITIFDSLLNDVGLDRNEIEGIVATGYGRNSVAFADKAITEIICHGVGAGFLNNEVRTIIDIGGQDSKAIALDPSGDIKDFAMNDKCAAGTGRFLEVMARALEVNLNDFGKLSLEAKNPSKISSTCTVFAESEVISLISKKEQRINIIAGIHESIATRTFSLIKRVGINEPVMMTGGVAKNVGVVRALENKLDLDILVLDSAQLTGAIGAAVMAGRLN